MNLLFKHKIKKKCMNEVYLCKDNELKNIFINGIHGKNFKIISTINEQSNKGTYIIKSNKTNSKYVLKIRCALCNNTFEKDICSILKLSKHKNVINFIDCHPNYFIYEYFEGQNLSNYITKQSLSESQMKHIFIQLVNAVNFLHSHNIIHCDLKLDNIIINKKEEIKIIDFDLSIITDNENGYVSNNIFGTMQYIAPESYDLCIYSKKTDIWQMGIILYILICNQFPHNNEISIVNSFSNLCRHNLFKHINLTIPKEIITKNQYSENLYKLLESMLCFNDVDRITIPDILTSPWLQ